MPVGPQGQRRPADVIGCAVTVAKIATGEMMEALKEPSKRAQAASLGGAARSHKLTKEERSAIAKKAAAQRWG